MSDTTAPAPSILIVDDDERLRSRLARAFEARGYDTREAEGFDAAVRLTQEETAEFAVVDLRMPGPSGLALIKALREADSSTRIVVLTGYGSIATALEAVKLGAVHYLTKPADVDELIAALSGADDAGAGTDEHTSNNSCAGPSEAQTPTLARVEWEHINRVLVDCDGNISKAAKRLGLHRRSLQRKLAKFPTLR